MLFLLGDGLEGADLHLHAGSGSGFNGGHATLAADKGDVDATGGHHLVAFLEAVTVGLLFLGFLALRTDKEKVEHSNHQDNHDAGFPTIGDVEEYKFCHHNFSLFFV